MLGRARSLSRLHTTTSGRETTPSIYDYTSLNDNTSGSGFSTLLNIYAPTLFGSTSHSTRATSVARSKDIDDEIVTGSRYDRMQSVGRSNHLKTRRPYATYGIDDFDHYTERIRDKLAPALDSYSTQYKPRFGNHSASNKLYSSSSNDDWRYRSVHSNRSSSVAPSLGRNSSHNYRFNDSIDRITPLRRKMRDLDYTRELRQLSHPTSTSYSKLTPDDLLLNRAREDVRRAVEMRAGGSGSSKNSNPRDFFGRTYVQYEKDGVTDVGVKYNGLSRSVDAKPGTWKAEDIVDTAYELQTMNDDTVDKLYENRLRIDKNRQWLLQDKAGVAPRMYHFDISTRQARRDVDKALNLVRNLKQLKGEMFNRLSQPWVFGKYLYK